MCQWNGMENNTLTIQLLEEKEVKVSDEPNKNYDAEVQTFRALAGDSDADMLKNFIDEVGSGIDVNIEPIVLSPSSDKSHRTVSVIHIHEHTVFKCFSRVFTLSSHYICIPSRLCIIFSRRS